MAKMKGKRAVNLKGKQKGKTPGKVSAEGSRSTDDPQGRNLTAAEEHATYLSDAKTVRCEIRLTHRQQQSVELAANLLGFKNASEYIRYTLQENSRKVIEDQSILEIAERDRERFMNEITNPKGPGKALKDAAKEFRETFKRK